MAFVSIPCVFEYSMKSTAVRWNIYEYIAYIYIYKEYMPLGGIYVNMNLNLVDTINQVLFPYRLLSTFSMNCIFFTFFFF